MKVNPVSAPFGYHPGTRFPRKSPAADYEGRGTCRYCGERGLVWEQIDARWILTTVGGKRHVCKEDAQERAELRRLRRAENGHPDA